MSSNRETHFTCLRCTGKQFKGLASAKYHVKNYHKAKGRKAVDQFFLDWIITPVPIYDDVENLKQS